MLDALPLAFLLPALIGLTMVIWWFIVDIWDEHQAKHRKGMMGKQEKPSEHERAKQGRRSSNAAGPHSHRATKRNRDRSTRERKAREEGME